MASETVENDAWRKKQVLPNANNIKSFDDFYSWLEGLIYAVGIVGSAELQENDEIKSSPLLVRNHYMYFCTS